MTSGLVAQWYNTLWRRYTSYRAHTMMPANFTELYMELSGVASYGALGHVSP